jgi:hypothetical protein
VRETFYTVAGCPKRVALVTDLHERPYEAALDSLRLRQPELICAAGDFVLGNLPKSGPKLREAGVLPFFSACAALAPCFVSLGNHEWMLTPEDEALLRATGAVLLDDEYTALDGAVIGGLTSARVSEYRRLRRAGNSVREADEKSRDTRNTPPRLKWLEDFCVEPGYHILLCHHPEYYPRWLWYRDLPLILSGHAHGGQVRLFGRGLYAPGQGLFPKLTAGVTEGRLVVSRGLSNHEPFPRLFNPPELVYIEP